MSNVRSPHWLHRHARWCTIIAPHVLAVAVLCCVHHSLSPLYGDGGDNGGNCGLGALIQRPSNAELSCLIATVCQAGLVAVHSLVLIAMLSLYISSTGMRGFHITYCIHQFS